MNDSDRREDWEALSSEFVVALGLLSEASQALLPDYSPPVDLSERIQEFVTRGTTDELTTPWKKIERNSETGEYNTPREPVAFWVGAWFGRRVPDEDNNFETLCWLGAPVWREAISHNEEHNSEFSGIRGWNHRNGALGGNAEYWRPLDKIPHPPHGLPILDCED